jgi:hypothetical protein
LQKQKIEAAFLIVNAGFPQGTTHVPLDIVPQPFNLDPQFADDGSGQEET